MAQKEKLSNNMLLKKALDIATNAHKEQTDKAGKPYILHPIRVSERCNTVEEKIVALLQRRIVSFVQLMNSNTFLHFVRNSIIYLVLLMHYSIE